VEKKTDVIKSDCGMHRMNLVAAIHAMQDQTVGKLFIKVLRQCQ